VRAAPAALALAFALAAPAAAGSEGILDSMGCIARAVYWEARDQPFDGQLGVAFVVLNRQRASGRTACDVVDEPGNFSGVARHRNERAREARAWALAEEIAVIAWEDPDADPTGAATYFHRLDAHPAWSAGLTLTRRIGAHLFFRVRTAAPAAVRVLLRAGDSARRRHGNAACLALPVNHESGEEAAAGGERHP
jgi:spore germination cell wall hydrolase CwlJ-like protein